jgi:hypothetical protein
MDRDGEELEVISVPSEKRGNGRLEVYNPARNIVSSLSCKLPCTGKSMS